MGGSNSSSRRREIRRRMRRHRNRNRRKVGSTRSPNKLGNQATNSNLINREITEGFETD